MLVICQEDLSKVTIAQWNKKIMDLTGAVNDSGYDCEESVDESKYSSKQAPTRLRRKSPSSKAERKTWKQAQKHMLEMEEKLKALEAEKASSPEVFSVQPIYKGGY